MEPRRAPLLAAAAPALHRLRGAAGARPCPRGRRGAKMAAAVAAAGRSVSAGTRGASGWGGGGSCGPGWRYGGGGAGRSGRMLYQARGRSSTSRRIFPSRAPVGSARIACVGLTDPGSGLFGQYITILFVIVHEITFQDGNINP